MTRKLAVPLTLTMLATVLSPSQSVVADEVTVKGTTLQGTVKAVTAEGIEFETIYGKGTLFISAGDIQALNTEGSFYVLHGDEQESVGRLLGIDDGVLLVGDAPRDAVRIEMPSIQSALTEKRAEETIAGTMQRRWRYWEGDLDLGADFKKATSDEQGFSMGIKSERRKKPTRLVFTTNYLNSTKKDRGESETTLENELKGGVKGEFDVRDRWFILVSTSGEYDEVERMSFRGVSTLGPGYRFYETATEFLQGEVGGAHVYERFFGGDTNDFFSIRFGGEGRKDLPYGAELNASAEFLPAVEDFTGDYLIRGETSLSFPLVNFLSFRFAITDEYDSTPAEDTDRNELKTTMGLSLGF